MRAFAFPGQLAGTSVPMYAREPNVTHVRRPRPTVVVPVVVRVVVAEVVSVVVGVLVWVDVAVVVGDDVAVVVAVDVTVVVAVVVALVRSHPSNVPARKASKMRLISAAVSAQFESRKTDSPGDVGQVRPGV